MKHTTCLLVAVVLAVGLGCAKSDWIDRTLVTENVSGSWYGKMGSPTAAGGNREDFWLTLKQEGSKVTGQFRSSGRLASWMTSDGTIEGTMAGDLFKFTDVRRTITGEFTVSGDEMTGQLRGTPSVLHRVESSPVPPPATQ